MSDKHEKKKSRKIPINFDGKTPDEIEPVDEFDELLEKVKNEESEIDSDKVPLEPVEDSLESKLKAMTENWQRERASFQNYKRRVEEERKEIKKYAIFDLAFDLLKVLDYFEASVSFSENLSGSAENVIVGVKYTIDELKRVLSSHNITPISADAGTAFDPTLMEAIERRETHEFEPGTVIEVRRSGWMLYDRVLRSAQVVVASERSDMKTVETEPESISNNVDEGGE